MVRPGVSFWQGGVEPPEDVTEDSEKTKNPHQHQQDSEFEQRLCVSATPSPAASPAQTASMQMLLAFVWGKRPFGPEMPLALSQIGPRQIAKVLDIFGTKFGKATSQLGMAPAARTTNNACTLQGFFHGCKLSCARAGRKELIARRNGKTTSELPEVLTPPQVLGQTGPSPPVAGRAAALESTTW